MKYLIILVMGLVGTISAYGSSYTLGEVTCTLSSQLVTPTSVSSAERIFDLPDDTRVIFQSLSTSLGLTYHGFIVQQGSLQLGTKTVVTGRELVYVDGQPSIEKEFELSAKGKIGDDFFSCETLLSIP